MAKVSHHAELLRRHVEDLYEHATLCWKQGGEVKLEEAEKVLRHALVLSPMHADSTVRLACVLEDTGLPAEAEEMFATALEFDPGHKGAMVNLAVLYARSARFGASEQLFRRALVIDNKDVDTIYNLGSLLKEMGRLDEADAMYRRAQYICNGNYNRANAGWCTTYAVYQAHAHDTGEADECLAAQADAFDSELEHDDAALLAAADDYRRRKTSS